MRETFEISDRFLEAGDANDLLYEPVAEGMTFRRTRRYELEYNEGKGKESDTVRKAIEAFVHKTLYDPICQEIHTGEGDALSDYTFALDYGMKPGALDLEKEAVLSYYRGLSSPGFELLDLQIRQRIYVYGSGTEPDRFVRDICNPAIHQWNVLPDHV